MCRQWPRRAEESARRSRSRSVARPTHLIASDANTLTTRTLETLLFKNGDVSLHAVAAGPHDGPVVVLLHGFPEFWFGWRQQIEPLAAAGLRVIAPDQRVY